MSQARFDRNEVLERATRLFWSRGFHATSMRALQEATDLRPGSLYACFGSKEALFLESLRHYAAGSRQRLQRCIAAAGSPLRGLCAFFHDNIVGTEASRPSELCMLVKSVSELTEQEAPLLAEARRLLKEMEKTFAEVLFAAREAGELKDPRPPEQLARLLQMQMMGLRTWARVSGSRSEAARMIDELFAELQR